MAKLAWCVKDKSGIWCRTNDGRKPDDSEPSVYTACGDWIILPHGIARRKPTCTRCSRPNSNGGGS